MVGREAQPNTGYQSRFLGFLTNQRKMKPITKKAMPTPDKTW